MNYDWSNKIMLLVEDTKINVELMLIMLKSTNIKVDVVSNGQEFMNKIHKINYDIVLMDIGLPGKLNGYDLIRYIHKKKLNIPIIIQSANPQCVHLQNNIDEDYVEKPINYDILFSKINKYLFGIVSD